MQSVQKLTRYLNFMELLLFCYGQNILEDLDFFLSLLNMELQLFAIWASLLQEHISLLQETMLNIDWHDILPFLYFDEFFHDS